MTGQQGDLMRMNVSGTDAGEIREFLEALIVETSPGLVPADDYPAERQHFDVFTLAMDFIIGTSAGLSAEGIRNLVAECWKTFRRGRARRKTGTDLAAEQAIPEVGATLRKTEADGETPDVTVKVSSDGLIEVQVRMR